MAIRKNTKAAEAVSAEKDIKAAAAESEKKTTRKAAPKLSAEEAEAKKAEAAAKKKAEAEAKKAEAAAKKKAEAEAKKAEAAAKKKAEAEAKKAEAAAKKKAEAEAKKAEAAAKKKAEAEAKKAEAAAKKKAEAEAKKAEAAAKKKAEAEAKKAEKKPAARKTVRKKAEAAPKKEIAAAKAAGIPSEILPEEAETMLEETIVKKADAVAEKMVEITEEAKQEVKAEIAEEAAVNEAVSGGPAPEKTAEEAPAQAETAEEAPAEEEVSAEEAPAEEAPAPMPEPRRSIAFIGSECYPFVKTGGLGDVMYALPRALVKQNCDVKVILPRYKCIPEAYQQKMVYRGAFNMDLCADGRSYYVGIMEYVMDGVVYDFIDNEEFFSWGNPYTNLVDDIAKYCYFDKAALAALNFMDWTPDVIHCHDWQAGLVPLYLRTMFQDTPVGRAKVMITIHNLRFQGIYSIEHIKYWSGLPAYLFNKDVMTQNWIDANMFKGGLTYANMITTVSPTYAGEIQTGEYGEGLDAHLRYHSGKLRGIINGIDYDLWDPSRDTMLSDGYDITNVLEKKRINKLKLQEELGLEQDENKFVIGLISRLTSQKGLDLVNAILPQLIDGNTQVVVLGAGDPYYEESFRYYENAYKGSVCSNIMYNEARAHHIYAGADALLVPSRFEPCGLTQLIAMHYGTVPIVRETGGLKDTVEPYNEFEGWGNGFTFDRYDAGLLLNAINYAKTVYFTDRWHWDEMVQRDMAKDVSWDASAKQYRDLYLELTM